MEATRNNVPGIFSDEEEINGDPEDVIMIPDCEGIRRQLWMT